MNLCVKSKPVTAGANASGQIIRVCAQKPDINVASAPAVTGWAFMPRFSFLEQCRQRGELLGVVCQKGGGGY